MDNRRIYTYYNEAVSLLNGEMISPRMAILYPVYGCNFFCKGCLCTNFNKEKVFMDFEKFKILTSDLKKQGIKSIELCGGGEPLLHPDIKQIITWITNKLHLNLGIMTNGSLLNDELNYLLVTKATYVRISLYDGTIDFTIEKIKKLIELKKLLGSDLKIGVKFLISKRNYKKIIQQISKVAMLDLDLISLKAERNSEHELDDETLKNVKQEIDNLNIPHVSATLGKTELKTNCWLSPIHTLIDPYGDMYICCYYTHREEQHKIGNVFEEGFKQLWGSSEHLNKIKSIGTKECNVYDCRWHGYNNEMKKLFETNEIQHQFC